MPALQNLAVALYLIEILHQTTTMLMSMRIRCGLYLIEILHQTTTVSGSAFPRASLYLIEILHQTTTRALVWMPPCRCILSKFYIKPQRKYHFYVFPVVVSYRNSTSNHNSASATSSATPVVSYRNSTSNHNSVNGPLGQQGVVSYRNSTSNHNCIEFFDNTIVVVSYRNSTSNHNRRPAVVVSMGLYLIEILHQTTTEGSP